MNLELTLSDMRIAEQMLCLLDAAAAIDGVSSVTITYECEVGKITVGYGESGDPAIIFVDPGEEEQ